MFSARLFALFVISLLILHNFSLVSADSYDLAYDANGNLISDETYTYTYNSLNQLSIVYSQTGIFIAQYFYDADGSRIKKVALGLDGTNTTTYYVDKNFIVVVNASGTFNSTYYYADDNLVAKKEAGRTSFYHPDSLGSTSLVTNASGDVIEDTSYLPFGEVLEGGDSRFLFTGKEKDRETGLQYYGSRYYDPESQRFTQPDDVLPDVYDPQQLNRYSYAINNPYSYTDPSGNVPVPLVLGGIGFGAGFVGSVLHQAYQAGGHYSNINYGQAAKTGAVWGIGAATFGLVSAPVEAALVARGISTIPAGIGGGTTAGVLTGEAGLITSSVLNNDLGRLTDPMAHAEAIGYSGLGGGVLGGIGGLAGKAGGSMREIPKVSDAKLQNYVNDFYKGIKNPNRIGSGTTADAIRYELRTGESVGGRTHIQKGQDLLRGLNRWVGTNPNSQDANLAKSIARDLTHSLRGVK